MRGLLKHSLVIDLLEQERKQMQLRKKYTAKP